MRAAHRECVIKLNALSEFREIEEQSAASLKVWLTPIRRGGERLEVVVGVLPADLGDDAFLRSLDRLAPPSLMAVLSQVRTIARAPVRALISDLRRGRYRHISGPDCAKARELFLRHGLCVLAFVLEEPGTLKARIPIRERWARRAHAARVQLPAEMAAVRSRYQEMLEKRVDRHRGIRKRRAVHQQ